MKINKNRSGRILFLVSSMGGGGAERVAALLCNFWVDQGYEVMLVPTYSGRGECFYVLDQRVRLEYLADHVGTAHKSAWTGVHRLWILRNIIRDYSPDVILSFLTHVNVVAIVAAAGLSIPVVVSERSYGPLLPIPWYWRGLRRLCYPFAHRVIAQTEKSREWIEKNCPGSSVRVIANPVVIPVSSKSNHVDVSSWVQEGRKMLLTVGRLGEEKNFSLLMDAFSSIAENFPLWDLVILGEGPERNSLESQCKKLNLKQRVFLPGRCGNVGEWYERSDLFVMSSRYEGFPNALLEAMAYGKAVVAFDCDAGPGDIIDHEINGLLVSPSEGLKGMVDAMVCLMENEDLRNRLSVQATVVKHRYSLRAISDQWLQVIE